MAHAVILARTYRWAANESAVLAKGLSPEDFVAKAIELVIDGKAGWDPARGTLVTLLKTIVKNEMLKALDSAAGRHERRFAPGDETNPTSREAEKHQDIGPSNPTPEDLICRAQDEAVVGKKIDDLLEAIDDTEELLNVVEKIMDGVEPRPRFIAEALGISVDEVNNRLKRLRRKAADISGGDA